jgi:hypothetical protein
MLFWMARRTIRSCTPRNSSGGGAGCLLVLLAVAAIGGIAGTSTPPQAAAPPGWTQGPDGVFVPITGHPAPPPVHVPAAPVAAATPNMVGVLITIGVTVAILGGLALLGSRMAPAKTRVPDFYTCCRLPVGTPHATTCPTQRPPEPPHGQAWYSNRR